MNQTMDNNLPGEEASFSTLIPLLDSFFRLQSLGYAIVNETATCLFQRSNIPVGDSVASSASLLSQYSLPCHSTDQSRGVFTNVAGFSELAVAFENSTGAKFCLVAGQFVTELSNPEETREAALASGIMPSAFQKAMGSLPAFDHQQVAEIISFIRQLLSTTFPQIPAVQSDTNHPLPVDALRRIAFSKLISEQVFYSHPDAHWLTATTQGDNFVIAALNHAYQQTTGLNEDQLVGLSLDALAQWAPADSLQRMHLQMKEAFDTKKQVVFSETNRVPAGTFTVEITLIPFPVNPNLTFILGRAHDITQPARLSDELNQTEQTYRELFHGSPDAILIADLKTGIILDANRKAFELTGYRPDELIGMHQSKLHPTKNTNTFEAHTLAAREVSEMLPLRNIVITARGHEIPVEIMAGHMQYRGKKVLCGVFRDIRGQLEYEKQLIDSEAKFRELAENAPAIVYRFSFFPEPHFEYVSPACTAITGYTPEEHYAQPELGQKIIHPDDLPLLQQFMQNPGRKSLTLRWIARDGSIKWTTQRLNVICDDQGNPVTIEGLALDETVQREALNALLESEQRFSEYILKAPDGITIVNQKGQYLDANPAACEFFGYTREELLSMSIGDLVATENMDDALLHIQKVVTTGKAEGIFTFNHPDGRKMKGMVSAASLAGDRFIGFVKDVTEQVEVLEALKRSEDEYHHLFDKAHDAIIIFQPHDEVILEANQKACNLYGYTYEELLGKSLLDFSVNPERGKEWIEKVMATGSVDGFETRHVNRNGDEIVFEATASFVDYRGTRAILSINRDITDRRQAEIKLKESEALYRQLTENLTDVVWTMNLEGKFLYLSPAATSLFGYSVEEAQKMTFKDLLTNASIAKPQSLISKAREEIANGIKQESPVSFEVEQYHKDGHTMWVDVKVTRVYDASGRFAYFLGMSRDVTWRHQAEQQLRESELQLRTALMVTNDVVWDWDVLQKKLIWNRAGEQVFGWTDIVQEPQHEDWWGERVHPDDYERANSYCLEVVNNPELTNWTDEYRFRRANGQYALVMDRGYVIRDQEGVALRMIGAMLDITDQRKAEETIRRNAECDTLLLKLYSSANEITENELFQQVLSVAMQVTKSSSGFCHRLSADQQTVIPTAWDRATKELCKTQYPQSYDLKCTGIWTRCLETNQPYVCNQFNQESASKPLPEGHVPVTRFMSIPVVVDNQVILIFGVGNKPDDYDQTDLDLVNTISHELTKILEKRANHTSLAESNLLNETLLRTIPFAIDIVDFEGNVLFMNDNLRKLLPGDISGKKCWELYRDDQTQCIDCPLKSAIKQGETRLYESGNVMGGRIFEINHTGMIFKGKPAVLEIFRDITSRKQTEADLVAARNKAEEVSLLRSRLLANLSHEIRTPLNGIMGFAEYLQNEVTDADQHEMVQSIYQSGERLLDTLTGILDLSAFESTFDSIKLKVGNLNLIAKKRFSFFENAAVSKGLQIEFLAHEEYLPVLTKEELVGKIIGHLLSNAIKFTRKGGVTITTGSTLIEEKKFAFVKVSDTGIGIASEHLGLIFEEFRQVSEGVNRAYEGTGLGLHISQRFAQLLGGRITVESRPGEGSVFTLWLPAYTNLPANQPQSHQPAGVEQQPADNAMPGNELPHVLLVEDDEPSAILAEIILKKQAVMHRVATGEEAIRLLGQHRYDAVLMDINLGSGMSGIATVEKIREMPGCNAIPIAAITANALDGHREEYLSRGCSHYLTKPYRRDELLHLLKQMTG